MLLKGLSESVGNFIILFFSKDRLGASGDFPLFSGKMSPFISQDFFQVTIR